MAFYSGFCRTGLDCFGLPHGEKENGLAVYCPENTAEFTRSNLLLRVNIDNLIPI
ncbi:hypothetical protein [Stenoxybacter acetivorans]|uniref:hypothetical protein n=1 Tax=Stenoxybacter acetivorans TaxID=422441 RepID=UPI0012EC2FB8|nr:hypothetical protein [Stenoxybacter acetivorans]